MISYLISHFWYTSKFSSLTKLMRIWFPTGNRKKDSSHILALLPNPTSTINVNEWMDIIFACTLSF